MSDPHKSESSESSGGDGSDDPGNQRNFYRHVSGAGEGQALQTTADFNPKAADHIVNPVSPESNAGELLDSVQQPPSGNGSPETEPPHQPEVKDTYLEPDWQKKIRDLQDQVIFLVAFQYFKNCELPIYVFILQIGSYILLLQQITSLGNK